MEHAVSSEGEGVWLWVGGYLYLARSVSRTPKAAICTDGWGGGGWEARGANAATDITRFGSHSFLFRDGGRAVGGRRGVGGCRFLAGHLRGYAVNVTEQRS